MTIEPRPIKPKAKAGKTMPRKQAAGAAAKRKISGPDVAIDMAALTSSVGYSLRRAQLSTYADFTAAMTQYNVRPSHYVVLLLIRTNPGFSQSAVSGSLGIQKANFVTLLDSLEARGWTERRAVGGDRRTSALHLTASGEVFVAKLVEAHDAMERRLATRLGERQTATLLKLLHKFSDAGDANVKTATINPQQ